MKVKAKELLNAVSAVSATKEDIILAVKDNAGIMTSTDSKSGIQIQSRFEVEGNEGECSYYLSSGAKESIKTLTSFSDNLEISETVGNLKIKAGTDAKISLGLLDEAPVSIKISEKVVGYQLSGKELAYCMQHASYAENITFIVDDNNNIDVYAVTECKIVKSSMKYLMSKRVKEKFETSSAVDEKEGKICFSVQTDVWKRISSLFNEEFCVMYISENQLTFIWNDRIIVIPLLVSMSKLGVEHTFSTLMDASDKSFVLKVKDSESANNALSLALLAGDGGVTFKSAKDKLELSSISSSAKLNLKNSIEEKCEAKYNGKHLKGFFDLIKNCADIQFTIRTNKLMIAETKNNYVYQQESGDDVIQSVNVICMFTPVLK